MKQEVLLSEFEWYLRDYFFRMNNDSKLITRKFDINQIVDHIHKNYLRYKSWKIDQINEMLDKVLIMMQEKRVLDRKTDKAMIELYSKFDRKQCVNCYYINYISIKEVLECQRCNSKNLKEFSIKKNNASK